VSSTVVNQEFVVTVTLTLTHPQSGGI